MSFSFQRMSMYSELCIFSFPTCYPVIAIYVASIIGINCSILANVIIWFASGVHIFNKMCSTYAQAFTQIQSMLPVAIYFIAVFG